MARGKYRYKYKYKDKYKYKYKYTWSLTLSCTTRGVESGTISVGLRLSTHHRKQHLREAAKSSFNAATKRHNILIEQRRKRRFVRKIFLSRLEIEGALVKPASLSDPMKQLLSTQGRLFQHCQIHILQPTNVTVIMGAFKASFYSLQNMFLVDSEISHSLL